MPLLFGTCQNCGTEVKYYSSRSEGKFCSQECFHNQNVGKNHFRYKKKETITCIQCGKDFKVWPSIAGNRQFCSIHCKGKWQKENLKEENNPNWRGGPLKRVCKNCQKIFYVPKHLVRQQPCIYCSPQCTAEYINKNPELKHELYQKIFKARAKRPNGVEKRFLDIIEKNQLPYDYTGDGSIVIGSRCPDFVYIGESKKVIELFGYYFHSPQYRPEIDFKRTYKGTMDYYKDLGYDCLIFWEDEIENEQKVVEQVRSFTGDMICV